MSALVMAEEVARFNAGEETMARFHAFIALFAWPISYLFVLVIAWMLVPLPGWALHLLTLTVMGALAWESRRHHQALRDLDTMRDSIYGITAADTDRPIDVELMASEASGRDQSGALVPMGHLSLFLNVILAAPRCTAKALKLHRSRIIWSMEQLEQAETAFETLGGHGDGWTVLASILPEDASQVLSGCAVMSGLENMGLTENRIDTKENKQVQVRLTPEIRRRYFPKNPGTGFPMPTYAR